METTRTIPNLDVLTVKDVCRLLHISERTLKRLLKDGDIPAHKVGRQWRFIYEEVMEWLVKN